MMSMTSQVQSYSRWMNSPRLKITGVVKLNTEVSEFGDVGFQLGDEHGLATLALFSR